MAIARFGAIVTDVRGKVGGHVFQGNGLTTSMRTNFNAKGGFQNQSAIFKGLNFELQKEYQALSAADKNQWQVLAQQYPLKDVFGGQKFLTGRNLFLRNYSYFIASGQTGTIDPYTAIGDLPSSELQHVDFDFSNQEIDVQFVNDRFSQAVIVYALPVSKYGLSIQPNKLPFLYGENDETPQDDLLWDAFFAKYPEFGEGDPCQFGVVQVNEFGFASFKKTIYGTYV